MFLLTGFSAIYKILTQNMDFGFFGRPLKRATFNIKNWVTLINATDVVLLAQRTHRRVMPFGRYFDENAEKRNQFRRDWLFDEFIFWLRTVWSCW